MRKLVLKRVGPILLSITALMPSRSAAQTRPKVWSIAVTTSLTSFRGAAHATDPDEIAIRPGQSMTLGVALTRHWNPWAVSLGIDYLPTHLEAVSSDIVVQDRTTDLERVRVAVTVARRLARIGGGALELRVTPALDNWSADNENGRTVVAGEAAVAAQVPVGPLMLENVLGIGWSPGPFRAAELPSGYERQTLRTIRAGIGLRVGL